MFNARLSLSGFTFVLAAQLTACGPNVAEVELEGGETGVTSDELEYAFPGQLGQLGEGEFEVMGEKRRLSYRYVQGQIVVDGDMIIGTDADWDQDTGTVEQGAAAVATRYLWPNKTIPYVIDPSLPNQARVTNAIAVWHSKTKVRFVPRTTQSTYVKIVPGGGCSASVGYRTGVRTLTLGSGCSTGNTIHELGHIAGLWHEQSRADRDGHVTVKWENIQAGMEHNFKTYTQQGQLGQDVGAYDFGSVMHYSSSAFSKNGLPTLVKKDGSTFSVNRTTLSEKDVAAINVLYP